MPRYDSYEDCLRKNKDRPDPQEYCAKVRAQYGIGIGRVGPDPEPDPDPAPPSDGDGAPAGDSSPAGNSGGSAPSTAEDNPPEKMRL